MTYKVTVFCDDTLLTGIGNVESLDKAINMKNILRDDTYRMSGYNIMMVDDDMQSIIRHSNGKMEFDTILTVEKE